MDGDADLEDCIRFCAYLFGASAAEDTPFAFFAMESTLSLASLSAPLNPGEYLLL